MEIKFTVPGQPVPQGRPRFTTKPFVRSYDPPKSAKYKNKVKKFAEKIAPEKPLQGELYAEILIFKETLKSFNKTKKAAAEARTLRPTTKPDADNYAKGILDAVKGIIWEDDGQVVDLVTRKFYSEIPRAEITIKEISDVQEKLF